MASIDCKIYQVILFKKKKYSRQLSIVFSACYENWGNENCLLSYFSPRCQRIRLLILAELLESTIVANVAGKNHHVTSVRNNIIYNIVPSLNLRYVS